MRMMVGHQISIAFYVRCAIRHSLTKTVKLSGTSPEFDQLAALTPPCPVGLRQRLAAALNPRYLNLPPIVISGVRRPEAIPGVRNLTRHARSCSHSYSDSREYPRAK